MDSYLVTLKSGETLRVELSEKGEADLQEGWVRFVDVVAERQLKTVAAFNARDVVGVRLVGAKVARVVGDSLDVE